MIRLATASLFALCTIAATARADATFYNATSQTLTIEATYPNGAVEKYQLRDGTEVSSSRSIVAPKVAKLAVRIFDDLGSELWKGTTGDNDVYVTIPDGKATKTVYAGLIASGFDTPKAALFLDLTGDRITLDLEGMNGIGAHRGIKPGGFDPKQVVRLDPKESYFTAIAKGGPAGEVKIKSTKVQPGHYYVVMKHSRDTYRLLSLGYLAPARK